LKTDANRTVDEYRALMLSLLQAAFPKGFKISQAIISSVVPPVTPSLVRLVQDFFRLEPLQVGPGIKTGLAIKTTDPAAVGADRVVNAVAAKEFFGLPALVIDFGTATTFDYIDEESNYQGGIIAPGINSALEALVRNTSKLPKIEIAWPKTVVGKNTVSAMQSGTVVGYLCLVEGLITRVLDEVGPIKHIIATGGLGELLSRHSASIRCYDPHLTLKGLALLARMNTD
jgi:type III pantothenate kinase